MNVAVVMGHFRLSASGGFKLAIKVLIDFFEDGMIHHADLAETLQAYYRARVEMKSEDRDEHIEYLKKTRKYEEEFDC